MTCIDVPCTILLLVPGPLLLLIQILMRCLKMTCSTNAFMRADLGGLFPFLAYTDTTDQKAVVAHKQQYLEQKVSADACVAFGLEENGVLSALALLRRLTWESQHFGGAFYSLDIFHAQEAESLTSFITWLLDAQLPAGAHVTVYVDAHDRGLLDALAECRFTSSGEYITLFVDRTLFGPLDTPGDKPGNIRDHEWFRLEEIEDVARKVDFPSRMYNDAAYEPVKIREMYAHWVKTMCAAPVSERTVMCYTSGGAVKGIAASRCVWRQRELSVFGHTLFGFLPGAGRNVYDRLIRAGLDDALTKATVVESSVSSANEIVIRTLKRMGHEESRRHVVMTRRSGQPPRLVW